jgi:hypothetical protein
MLNVWEIREVPKGLRWGDLGSENIWKRPRRSWENDIKMGLQEVGWGGMDWIDLAQDKDRWRVLVNAGLDLRVS